MRSGSAPTALSPRPARLSETGTRAGTRLYGDSVRPEDSKPASAPASSGQDPGTAPEAWRTHIRAARARLRPHLDPTPLVRSIPLTKELGRPAYLKLESLQPVGAFKVRPALNSILCRLGECRERGVIANSSGNFAQAVAYAAALNRVDALIVMMRSASRFKRDRTVEFGGRVSLCEDSFEARFEMTERLRRETGRLLLHPYDSIETIAGDATLGTELADQVEGDFDVFVPVSGGGLIAGTALAAKAARPGCRIYGAQAKRNPATKLSLEAGRAVRGKPAKSLADALTVLKPGARTFPIIQRHVEDVLLVSEQGLAAEVRWLVTHQKLIAEPGGAASVAAARLAPRDSGRPVVCVISGGNVAPELLRRLLGESAAA